jgi:hypothetical protein
VNEATRTNNAVRKIRDLLRNPVQAHSLIEKQEAPSVRELVLEGKSIIEASCVASVSKSITAVAFLKGF